MADISSPASYTKMNDIEISDDAALSTSLFYKLSGNMNKLIDDTPDRQSDADAVRNFTKFNITASSTFDGSSTHYLKFTTHTYFTGRIALIFFTEDTINNLFPFITPTGWPNVDLRRAPTTTLSWTQISNGNFYGASGPDYGSDCYFNQYFNVLASPPRPESNMNFIEYNVGAGTFDYFLTASSASRSAVTIEGFILELI